MLFKAWAFSRQYFLQKQFLKIKPNPWRTALHIWENTKWRDKEDSPLKVSAFSVHSRNSSNLFSEAEYFRIHCFNKSSRVFCVSSESFIQFSWILWIILSYKMFSWWNLLLGWNFKDNPYRFNILVEKSECLNILNNWRLPFFYNTKEKALCTT